MRGSVNGNTSGAGRGRFSPQVTLSFNAHHPSRAVKLDGRGTKVVGGSQVALYPGHPGVNTRKITSSSLCNYSKPGYIYQPFPKTPSPGEIAKRNNAEVAPVVSSKDNTERKIVVSSYPRDKLNVHSYDGMWGKEELRKITSHRLYNKAVDVMLCLDFKDKGSPMTKLRNKLSDDVAKIFESMCSDKNNWDSCNGIDSLVLLCLISLIEEETPNINLIKTLEEQLLDVMTGSCVQGKSTRLAQVLVSFI